MHRLMAVILMLLLAGTPGAWAREKAAKTVAARPDAEDMKIIAVMEILQLLDLTEEMEMIKEMEYLIEDDRDEE